MALTTGDWIKLIVAAALTVCGHYFIREWYQPYVQYGTGGSYIHSKLAIASLGLKNWGHSDAENVTITASFADPLMSISTDQIATPFESSSGGIGQKFVIGTIKRLVPGERVNVYFITEPSSPGVDLKPSIRGPVKFNGGMGSTGLPILFFWGPQLLVFIVLMGVMIPVTSDWVRRDRRSFINLLSEAIQLGASARQEGLSAEQLTIRVENFYRALPFYSRHGKETLIAWAQAALEGAKETPK